MSKTEVGAPEPGASTTLAADEQTTYFAANIAHPFIIGSALFGIFWGVVNALLVKDIDTTDVAVIAAVCKEEAPEEDYTPEEILARMDDVGDKITKGAISFLAQEYLYLGLFSAVFAAVLVFTVDW